jgi:hypothetical protein
VVDLRRVAVVEIAPMFPDQTSDQSAAEASDESTSEPTEEPAP